MSKIQKIQSTINYAVRNYRKGFSLLKNPKGASPYDVNMIKKQSTIFPDYNEKGIMYKRLNLVNGKETKKTLQVKKLRINDIDTDKKISLYRETSSGGKQDKIAGRTTYGKLVDYLFGGNRPKNKPVNYQTTPKDIATAVWGFNRPFSNKEYADRYYALEAKEKANHQTQTIGKFISTLISNLRNK